MSLVLQIRGVFKIFMELWYFRLDKFNWRVFGEINWPNEPTWRTTFFKPKAGVLCFVNLVIFWEGILWLFEPELLKNGFVSFEKYLQTPYNQLWSIELRHLRPWRCLWKSREGAPVVFRRSCESYRIFQIFKALIRGFWNVVQRILKHKKILSKH